MTVRLAQRLRLFTALAVFAALVVTAVRFREGLTFDNCETLCPFGGVEGLIHLIRQKQYLCVLSESNTALFIALVLLTVVAGRLFCSWLCPLGLLFEKLNGLRLKLGIRAFLPPPAVDRALQALRWVVLVVVIAATLKAGDLVFRGYDPFFALFSLHGHGIVWTSYAVLALALAAALFIPAAWCRYLCPLGAVMDPGSAVSLVRVARNEEPCTRCRQCERACPQALSIVEFSRVRDLRCTLCLQCLAACPAKGALTVKGPGTRAVRLWVLPALVAAFLLTAHGLAPALRVPTFEKVFRTAGENVASAKETTFIVSGLTCRGRSAMLGESLKYMPGLYGMKTFAKDRRLVLRHDSAAASESDIRECIEGSVRDPETDTVSAPFKVLRWY